MRGGGDLRERRRALVRAPGKARISVSITRERAASFLTNSTSFFGIAIIMVVGNFADRRRRQPIYSYSRERDSQSRS